TDEQIERGDGEGAGPSQGRLGDGGRGIAGFGRSLALPVRQPGRFGGRAGAAGAVAEEVIDGVQARTGDDALPADVLPLGPEPAEQFRLQVVTGREVGVA